MTYHDYDQANKCGKEPEEGFGIMCFAVVLVAGVSFDNQKRFMVYRCIKCPKHLCTFITVQNV
jgi:hypothetical protein